LPSQERERRQALEYEEDEIPPDTGEVVKEADVSFPNLPLPKSSDGNVRIPVPYVHRTLSLILFTRIG
jgi:hypothetical protein